MKRGRGFTSKGGALRITWFVLVHFFSRFDCLCVRQTSGRQVMCDSTSARIRAVLPVVSVVPVLACVVVSC